MARKIMSPKKTKKIYKHIANRTNVKNDIVPRGGIRL